MQSDDEFCRRIKQQLDDSVETLEPDIARRLQQARLRALEVADKNRISYWKPAAAFSLSLVLLLTVVLWPKHLPDDEVSPLIVDMELLANEDNLQFYEELEFYEWLLETDAVTG